MRKIIIVLLALCFWWSVTLGIDNGHATGTIPDITTLKWLVLGPFENPQDMWSGCLGFQHDYLKGLGGEANAHPIAGEKTAGGQWTEYRMEKGVLDFQRIFGPLENQVAYAYCQVVADKSQTVALKLGSDDGIKAWLNGRMIFSHHIHRAFMLDDDAVVIQLKPGLNRLLLKLDQGNGGWELAARLRSVDIDTFNWQRIKNKRYQICLDGHFIGANNQLSLSVLTLPSFAVREKVNLIARDLQGNTVLQSSVITGEPVTLVLPTKGSGVYQLEVATNDYNSDNVAEKYLVAVGQSKQIIKGIITKARQTAKLAVEHKNGEDFSATLTFLANQLEGRVHSSLITAERNIRAITTIGDICRKAENAYREKQPWPNASLRGIRQWAYRSAIDGSCQPYTVYLPDDYNPVNRYKLLVCLHGFSGDDYGSVQNALTGVKPSDFIVVAPLGRGDMAYAAIGEQDVLDVIDQIQRIYSIDQDCVYLTGWSMGGCGTWRIGQFYADRFAAIAPFCGWTSIKYLENLQNLPTLVVHGAEDPVVSVQSDRFAVSRLSELKAPYFYEELPGVDHDAWRGWQKLHGGNQLFTFFRKFRRNQWPERVELSIPYLRFGKHYWVQVKEFSDPQKPGYINAQVLDFRHLRVETDNIDAFTLDLRHPKLATRGQVLLDINGYNVPADAGLHKAMFICQNSNGQFAKQNIKTVNMNGLAKYDGGGIVDLFNRPLYIVYGTANPRRAKILRQAAEILGDWRATPAIPTGVKVGHFRIKADTDITDSIKKQYNLLLLGTITENRITAELMSKKGYWPISMTKGKVQAGNKKYSKSGLVMVYPSPVNRKQLVGFLALPYSEDDLLNYARRLTMAMTQYALDDGVGSFTTPDFMICSKSEIIRAGYFDSNWRLKE
jgi:pimeloyl-ACP methyl ester carboxylesterase